MPHHRHHPASSGLKTAFVLNLGFTVLELFGGWFSGSLAILSDAVHDLGDTASLGLALVLDGERHVVSCHAVLPPGASRTHYIESKEKLRALLSREFRGHTTIELEFDEECCPGREPGSPPKQ